MGDMFRNNRQTRIGTNTMMRKAAPPHVARVGMLFFAMGGPPVSEKVKQFNGIVNPTSSTPALDCHHQMPSSQGHSSPTALNEAL